MCVPNNFNSFKSVWPIADADLGISYLMQSVTDSKVSIELLEYRLAQNLYPMVKR